MTQIGRGRYQARLAAGADDLAAVLAMRARVFRSTSQGRADADSFDAACRHLMVEDRSGQLVCSYRLLHLADGRGIGRSYSAQFYDLTALTAYRGKMIEVGRFCTDPDFRNPDVLRVAWGALTRQVDANGIGMLFGCTSFAGTAASRYLDSFAWLARHHLAPARWKPRRKATAAIAFADLPDSAAPDSRRAMMAMPPLLRSYLAMGGWVSDHAVIDFDLNSLHVFTGLQIDQIPPARARLLRADS